jgi:hypothetical protein
MSLKDLVIVDRKTIRFPCACERDGVELRNCPRYVNAWTTREAPR